MSAVISEIAQGAAGGLLGGIKSILDTFVTDKSEAAKDKAAYALQQLVGDQASAQAQLAIDQAEAASPDRINHWRGGLGWGCVAGLLYNWVVLPIAQSIITGTGHTAILPAISDKAMDILYDIILTLLGSHAIPHVRDAITSFSSKGQSPSQ